VRFLVVSKALSLAFETIDARNIDDDVDHVAAQLVRLHVHRGAVRRHIDLAHHVDQKRLFNPTARDEDVEEVFESRELRNQLLDDLA